MWSSQLNRGASLLAALSMLGSLAAGEVFDKLHGVPDGWKEERSADASQQILLQVALKQHDASGFEQALLDMSTPGHQDYGKHFKSYDEMKNLLQPTDATVRSVRDWLESAGISDIEQDADWFSFATTVGVANSLLNTEFKWYKNDELETSQLRTLQYSVPGSVADHLNMVQPTTRFTQMHPTSAKVVDANEHIREAVESGSEIPCDKAITPSCLASLYNTDFYHADRHAPSSIGFCSYLGQSARWDDLELFEENIAQYAKGQNFSVVTYNGATNDQSSDAGSGEANLDAQYIVGVGYPLPVTEYITAGRGPVVPDLSYSGKNTNEPYLTFLQNILKRDQGDLPQVLSTSYGEDEQTLPESYARSVCNLYAQLGSRGVSVIFASGDSGVGSACQRNDGTERETFNPQFPAACPWVTSVGGTTNSTPEAATFFSSGGFSHYWSRPKYQDEAVSSYLDKLGDQWKGLYNPNGRGFPDVSAQSVKYAVYDKGELKLYQGTSCAAPTFSGVIGLLNNARMRFHQPPMGFLNPFLYGYGKYGLKDITHGGSTGCNGHDRFHGPPNGSPVIPYASWNATEGWDPVSGLGTPLFHRLKALSFFS